MLLIIALFCAIVGAFLLASGVTIAGLVFLAPIALWLLLIVIALALFMLAGLLEGISFLVESIVDGFGE